jgi:hypothetical protein
MGRRQDAYGRTISYDYGSSGGIDDVISVDQGPATVIKFPFWFCWAKDARAIWEDGGKRERFPVTRETAPG